VDRIGDVASPAAATPDPPPGAVAVLTPPHLSWTGDLADSTLADRRQDRVALQHRPDHWEGVMADARTAFRQRRDADGAGPLGQEFVWVSLRDPSSEELAAVQAELDLPPPLVDRLGVAARRPALEAVGALLVAVICLGLYHRFRASGWL
jgi:hypothetical protein